MYADACYTQIQWKTLSERDNDYFTVQKSSDGFNWIYLVDLKGAGTTSIPHTYAFTDSSNADGVSYYRLRQVDFDGQVEYHEPQSIEHIGCGFGGVYPNPTKGKAYLNLIEKNAQIRLYSLTGQDLTHKMTVDYENKSLNLENLVSGSYTI